MSRSLLAALARAVVISAVVGACSESESEDGSGGPDAPGAGGAAGGPAECESGSHLSETGGCESTLTTAPAGVTLMPARDHHTTLVAEAGGKAFLFVFGGGTDGNQTIFRDVQRASIADDGSLGPFEKVGEMPEPRLGHTTVIIGNRIVIAGGLTVSGNGLASLSSTVMTTLQDDGTLGPWFEGPNLPKAVMHHTCSAEGLHVYCIGGRISGNYTSDLAVVASLQPDGALSAYEPASPLAASIGFHQAFVHGRALYLAGGLHRDAPMADFDLLTQVSRAEIREDGSLGPWLPAGELPIPVNVGAAQVFHDRVYFVGGMHGSHGALDSILEGSFAADGSLADVVTLPAKLSTERMHVHQVPIYRNFLYVVAGRDGHEDSLGTVDIGRFQ